MMKIVTAFVHLYIYSIFFKQQHETTLICTFQMDDAEPHLSFEGTQKIKLQEKKIKINKRNRKQKTMNNLG